MPFRQTVGLYLTTEEHGERMDEILTDKNKSEQNTSTPSKTQNTVV